MPYLPHQESFLFICIATQGDVGGTEMNITGWLTILGFALSSSIDNFGVGVTYGISKIRISTWSNALIALIAFGFSEAGIFFGKYISATLPGRLSNVIAAMFLFVISIRIILMAMYTKKHSSKARQRRKTVMNAPESADMDGSGTIGFLEALILGFAVSMNALTNGLGAGLLGLSPLGVSVSAAVFSFLAIWSGVSIGQHVANIRIGSWTLGQFSTAISGLILLLIAAHVLLSN